MCSPDPPEAKEPEKKPLRYLLSRDQFEERSGAATAPATRRGGGGGGGAGPIGGRFGGSGGLTPSMPRDIYLGNGGLSG